MLILYKRFKNPFFSFILLIFINKKFKFLVFNCTFLISKLKTYN
jgi:hypothetical protein